MTAFTVQGIDHVVLRVVDVEGVIRFYQDVLGCAVERRKDDLGLIQLRAGRSLIDLVDVNGELGQKGGAAPGAEARNMDHFCLRIDPFDEAQIRAHLRAHGVEAGELAKGAVDPISDIRGSAEYKRAMVGVFLRRTVQAAVSGNGSH